MNPFDYVTAINQGKDKIGESDDPAFTERGYDAFLSNRAFSYYNDTLMQANEMNRLPGIDNRMQFDFLLHSIKPRKRWSKWSKPEKLESVELIKEYFGYNTERAQEASKILTEEQLEMIKQKLYRGGE